MKATQRLYLTADRKKVVPAGHPKAATLYCVPGDEIPQSAADKLGLVDGGLKGGGSKEDRGASNKERKPGEDKGGPGGGGEGAPQPDDLTKLAGVDAKTAAKLAAAGLKTFGAIADLDPSNPPPLEGLPPEFDWELLQKEAIAEIAAGRSER